MLSPCNVKRTANSQINSMKIAQLLVRLMKVKFCFCFVPLKKSVITALRTQTVFSLCLCAELPFNNTEPCVSGNSVFQLATK